MGRGWRSRVSSSKGGKKALQQKRREQGDLNAVAIPGEHDSECVVSTEPEEVQLAASLPSEGIMAIYQQFRQIWRRTPNQRPASDPVPSSAPLVRWLEPQSPPASLSLAQMVAASAA